MKLASAIAGLALLGTMAAAQANEIDVSYTVSGSSGSWVYDFSVTNNLISSPGGTSYIYLFGVELGAANVVGYPNANWGPPSFNSLNSGSYTGGQGINYGLNWINGNFPTSLLPGQTLSGFRATSTEATAHPSVRWFAFSAASFGGFYAGSFCTMNCGAPFTNPGFEYGAVQATSGVGDETRPAVTALRAIQPNPTREGAKFAFSLANPTDMTLRVYDVAGRLVRTVATEDLPAGTYVRAWDGRDDSGWPTKAGLYFVKFVAGSTVESRKLVRTQ